MCFLWTEEAAGAEHQDFVDDVKIITVVNRKKLFDDITKLYATSF